MTEASGKTLYANAEPVKVLTQGNPTYHVDVEVNAAG